MGIKRGFTLRGKKVLRKIFVPIKQEVTGWRTFCTEPMAK
jgi:hypothetical protein